MALSRLLKNSNSNITPAAGTVVRKSGRKKRKKWTGATHIALNPLSLSTGGTSDDTSTHNEYCDTSFFSSSDSASAGSAPSHRNQLAYHLTDLENGNCLEEYEQDEDDFLHQVLQVCNQEIDAGSLDLNSCNISGDNNNNGSLVDFTDIATDENHVELFDFNLQNGENRVLSWKAVRFGDRLYVSIPGGVLPTGSRECFVSLLEYAEDDMKVDKMYLCMNKDRSDRANLLRIYMFLGFEIIQPGSCADVPRSEKFLFMGYSFD